MLQGLISEVEDKMALRIQEAGQKLPHLFSLIYQIGEQISRGHQHIF